MTVPRLSKKVGDKIEFLDPLTRLRIKGKIVSLYEVNRSNNKLLHASQLDANGRTYAGVIEFDERYQASYEDSDHINVDVVSGTVGFVYKYTGQRNALMTCPLTEVRLELLDPAIKS